MSNILSRSAGVDDVTLTDTVETETPVTTQPVEGTSETHVKVFVQDVQDALKQIHAIVNETELKYQALLTKLGL